MEALHQIPAEYLDGQIAKRHSVLVTTNLDGLTTEIRDMAGQLISSWPMADIREVQDYAGIGAALYLKGDDDAARLFINRPQDAAAFRKLAPDLNNKDMTPGLWGKVVMWIGGAVLAMYLMIFVIVPALANRLAVLVPPEREAAVGHLVLTQFESMLSEKDASWFCTGGEGQAALDKMAQRLLGFQDLPYPLTVRAVDHDMFNAFALPGGQVVFMRGLIDRAETPEQVAGVLAHEIGHVANRDPMRHALQAAGTAGLISLLIGDVTGGALIALGAEQIVNASHSRKAEANADKYALARMKEANISPEAFAEFFDILLEDHGEAPEFLAWVNTHPASQDRADRARAAIDVRQTYDGIVTDAEWQAIKSMCSSGS